MIMREKNIIVVVLMILLAQYSWGQEIEQVYQSRTGIDLSFKPTSDLKVTISPELRFDDDFSVDKLMFDADLDYKLSDVVSLGTSYGLVVNNRESKATEYIGRYYFSATFKKDFNRFTPSFKLKYSNYADDNTDDKRFLRYKLGLKYNIKDCKLTPSVSTQLYQSLDESSLYKIRYAVGANYKINKSNYLKLGYKLDYHYTDYLNMHIFSAAYLVKF